MLGLALSMGASGVFWTDAQASAAVDMQSASMTSQALSELSRTSLAAPVAPAVTGQPRFQASTVYHTVEQGESLWEIAQDHQVPVQDIKVANRMSPDMPLQVGQVLKVPAEAELAMAEAESSALVSLAAAVGSESAPNVAMTSVEGQTEQLVSAGVTVADGDTLDSLSGTLKPKSAMAELSVVATDRQQDSLRLAGMVSESDGFRSELEKLEATRAEAPVADVAIAAAESKIPVVTALAPHANSSAYQVRPGDTLENIAESLGVSSEQLVAHNRISNPDMILAGQNIAIPEGAQRSPRQVSVPLVMTAAPTTSSPEVAEATRLARLQATSERRVNSADLLKRLQSEAQSEAVESPRAEAPAQAETTEPYTASLLQQVESAREQAGTAPTVLASTPPASESAPDVVNPDFIALKSSSADTAPPASPSAELLAAAPLDISTYSAPTQPATGQMVSPDMPILPSSSEYLPEAPNYFNGYIWPTRGTLTSGYGWRWGRMHRGVDVAGPVGTPIMAAAPGVVERAGWNSGGYGNLVDIRHPDGSLTRYAHNSRLLVRAGQQVAQGQQISEMGSTGRSTGPHLHFEIHLPNQGTVNPMALLPGR
jgi:murein DD-endopeptidase MepM/ murein hydrolase activator NlpD